MKVGGIELFAEHATGGGGGKGRASQGGGRGVMPGLCGKKRRVANSRLLRGA